MLFDLFFWFVWIFIIIIVHEFGHFWTAQRLGYEAKINLFSVDVKCVVSAYDDFWINLLGVLAGFVPLIIMPAIGFTLGAWLITVVLYIVATRNEIISIARNWRFFNV